MSTNKIERITTQSDADTSVTDPLRRKLMAGLTAGAGAAMLSTSVHASVDDSDDCLPEDIHSSAARFPKHAVVFDHHGRKLRFYDDLIKNKVVMLHFMSTTLEGDYQTAKNLAKVQTILGSTLGEDVFLLSITVDPQQDSVERLAEYAAQHNAAPGWSFITGTEASMQSIKDALFFRPGGHVGHAEHDQQDCSMGLIRYGNDAVGIWGSVPTRTEPTWLVERLRWMMPKTDIASSPVRGGPPVRTI